MITRSFYPIISDRQVLLLEFFDSRPTADPRHLAGYLWTPEPSLGVLCRRRSPPISKITPGADMRWLRTVGLCLLGIVLYGCTREKPPESKPQPAAMSDDALAAYRKKHPEALIGRVVAI